VVKPSFCLHRLPQLSRAEFQRYWRETHGPLVARHAALLRIRRYVQTHALETPQNDALRASRGTQEPYDGFAELWWDDFEDLAAALATPEGREASRALYEDELRFIDLAGSSLVLCEEHPIVAR
jgi:uncharacterized protein (TIGR02118 family)